DATVQPQQFLEVAIGTLGQVSQRFTLSGSEALAVGSTGYEPGQLGDKEVGHRRGAHLELGEGQHAVVGEVERMADAEPEAALTEGEAVFPSGNGADGLLQGAHRVVSGTTEELA